jgi:L-proline amide hydrolase
VEEGYADFEDSRTWYAVEGGLSTDSGAPAPLVVLHGGPGATHDYLLALADLARDGRAVVFYDQLGSGRSTHWPGREADYWTVNRFVRELANLIHYLGIDARYHLLGQSWGGCLAQEHAFTRPSGLRSLVLSNSVARFSAFAEAGDWWRAQLPPEVEATLRRHEAARTTDDPEYDAACQVFYRRHLCRLDPWPVELLATDRAMSEDPTVYHAMNGPSEFHVIGTLKDWQSVDRLSTVTVPTLILCGRYDEAPPEVQQVLVDGIDGSRLRVFEHSSHTPFWEERAAYMAEVDAFLRSHD